MTDIFLTEFAEGPFRSTFERLNPSDLQVGDIVYSCPQGQNIEIVITTAPYVDGEFDGRPKWRWQAKLRSGEIVGYLLTEGLEHYGPRIYRGPQYVSLKDGAWHFEIE